MWVLVCGAFLALTQDTGGAARTFLRVCLAIGIVAVMLSAQRSAAWALIPALIAIVLLSSTHLMRTLATMIIVSLASILTVTGSLLLREDRNPVTRLLERESVASDSAREESWALALNVLDGDPYFGLAFRTYSGDIGVHNGFLAGWAEFGLGWLLAVLLCLLMTSRHFLIMPATLAARFAGLCFIGMMLVNAMFHTIMVSRNDMVFMSLFGMMLAITGLPSHASQERLPSGANINRQDMGQAPLSAP
jgi:O-antigen ligase